MNKEAEQTVLIMFEDCMLTIFLKTVNVSCYTDYWHIFNLIHREMSLSRRFTEVNLEKWLIYIEILFRNVWS